MIALGNILALVEVGFNEVDLGRRSPQTQVLKAAKESGHITIANAVSAESDDYAAAAKATLPHLDVLVLNEWEAKKASGRDLFSGNSPQWDQFRQAAQQLHDDGATQTIVIHFPDGAYALSRNGKRPFKDPSNCRATVSSGRSERATPFAPDSYRESMTRLPSKNA